MAMQFGQIGHVTLDAIGCMNEQDINAFEDLEDTSHGRALGRFPHLVGQILLAGEGRTAVRPSTEHTWRSARA